MLHSLFGKLIGRRDNTIYMEIAGIGFKVLMPSRAAQSLPQPGSQIKIFCSLYARENEPFELFGFLSEQELYLFEKLTTVSGVGPKSAMAILGVSPIEQLVAAINAGKTDLLTKATGIGRKTAERVVVELRGK